MVAVSRTADTAAVFTIHGFCQHAQLNAFELACCRAAATEDESRYQACADFWRHIATRRCEMPSGLLEPGKRPQALLRDINRYLAKTGYRANRCPTMKRWLPPRANCGVLTVKQWRDAGVN